MELKESYTYLIDIVLETILFGPYQVTFNFSNSVYISVTGSVALKAGDKLLSFWSWKNGRDLVSFNSLLEVKTTGASWDEQKCLHISFENGQSLDFLFSTDEPGESYVIHYKDFFEVY
ncbi:MAG: hypothetical protein IT258_02330 [Saprospiraceae bacterium]|nr:hypothetical protein [Saprospiraceae bacterium]